MVELDDKTDFQKIGNMAQGLKDYEELDEWSYEQRQEIELGGRADFFRLRKRWSLYLAIILFGTVVFQLVVAMGVGLGFMEFPGNSVIYTIVGANFVQIVSLVIIVVRFLFSDTNPSKSEGNTTAKRRDDSV